MAGMPGVECGLIRNLAEELRETLIDKTQTRT